MTEEMGEVYCFWSGEKLEEWEIEEILETEESA